MPKTHLPGVFGVRLKPVEKLVTSLVPRLLAVRVCKSLSACHGECSFSWPWIETGKNTCIFTEFYETDNTVITRMHDCNAYVLNGG